VLDIAHLLCVCEHASKQAQRADRGYWSSRYAGEAARFIFYVDGGLAAHDSLKEALNVSAGKILKRLFPEQGDNVTGDPPPINFESARLLGQAFATNNEPCLGLL
jgi:hypothetical protein